MAQVQANGMTIEYEEIGDGEPLLLVMGLGGQLIHWPDGFVELLAGRGFRVVRFDNRDSGLSSKLTGAEVPTQAKILARSIARRPVNAPYYLTDMADDAAGLLTSLGIDDAHVVGMSMGGMIAQSMAISHRDRVRSLTSIMSNTGDKRHGVVSPKLLPKLLRMEEPTIETGVEAAVEINRLISGEHFDEAEARSVSHAAFERSFCPDGTTRQTSAIMASPSRARGLRAVTAPTLVIHGLQDPLVLPSGGIATAEAVPGSRVLMFPDMGHDLPEVRWGEMVDAISANAARGAARV